MTNPNPTETTTTERERVVCRVCSTESEHTYVASTSEDGEPDLDTRPPAPMRATLPWWVQRCPSCGYCAPSLAEGPSGAGRIVRTSAYQALLQSTQLPPLAALFVCASVVLEHAGDLAEAGWQAVYAAWACDDAAQPVPAVECRERASDLLRAALAAGATVAAAPGEGEALRADLLRRCGRFDDVVAQCAAALATSPPPVVETVLRYEQALASAGDRAAHTLAAARAWGAARN